MLKRILIIDSYQERVFSIQNILEKEGYEVYFALNNEEAISRLSVDEMYLIIYRYSSDIDNLTNLLNWIEAQNRLTGVSLLVIPDNTLELFKLNEKLDKRINKDIFFITDLNKLKENVSSLLDINYIEKGLLKKKGDAVFYLNDIKLKEEKLLSALRKEKKEIYKKRLMGIKSFKRFPKLNGEDKIYNYEDFGEMNIDYLNLVKSVNLKIKGIINFFRDRKKFTTERIEFIDKKLKELQREKIQS